jgi:hypothetical protein
VHSECQCGAGIKNVHCQVEAVAFRNDSLSKGIRNVGENAAHLIEPYPLRHLSCAAVHELRIKPIFFRFVQRDRHTVMIGQVYWFKRSQHPVFIMENCMLWKRLDPSPRRTGNVSEEGEVVSE